MTPKRDQLREMVKTVFGATAFPAKYDSALYVNFYDISQQFDINDLQLLLSLSHLVQNDILSDLTPVYCSYKVSTVDENEVKKILILLNSKINSDSNMSLDYFDENENNSEESKKLHEKNLKIILLVIDYIRKNAKRKWCQIDTVLLANEIACTPSEVVYCIGK